MNEGGAALMSEPKRKKKPGPKPKDGPKPKPIKLSLWTWRTLVAIKSAGGGTPAEELERPEMKQALLTRLKILKARASASIDQIEAELEELRDAEDS
jgi:hypothetical protein